ncbi:MAG: hypothetical protein ACHQNA_12585 [Acidimicrobiales bacterium]
MGGRCGRGGSVTIDPGTADQRSIRPLSDGTVVRRGQVIRFETAGGGGWGHPFDRPVPLVERDVQFGFVTAESAAADYGVVIDAVTGVADLRATAIRRAERPAGGLFHRGSYFD